MHLPIRGEGYESLVAIALSLQRYIQNRKVPSFFATMSMSKDHSVYVGSIILVSSILRISSPSARAFVSACYATAWIGMVHGEDD